MKVKVLSPDGKLNEVELKPDAASSSTEDTRKELEEKYLASVKARVDQASGETSGE